MTDPGKRKVSAKQIVTDIRAGMDAPGLKRKYGLSEKGFKSVCTRLVAAGALTENEIRRFGPRWSSSQTSPEIPKQVRWQCPACNTPQKVEMSECPVCGIVVDKFVARQEQEGHVPNVASGAMRDAGPADRANWSWVIISVVVFVLAGSSLLLWSTHKAKEAPKISKLDAGTQSLQRAGADSNRPPGKVSEPGRAGKDYDEVEVDDSQDTAVPQAPVAATPRETPERAVVAPREEIPPTAEKPRYVTGELRQFSSGDFKKEVVEASKTYPVLLQFYSQT